MNKKFMLSGVIVALTLLLVNAAFAVTGFTLANATTPSGEPGETVTVSFDLAATADKTVGFTSTELSRTGSTDTISAPSITTQTVASGETNSVSFDITLPSTLAGTYTATITGTDSADSTNTATLAYTVTVSSVNKLEVQNYSEDSALELIGEESEDDVTRTFTIKNTGSTALDSLSFDTNALDLTDADDDAITLSFSDAGTLNPGDSKSITIDADFGSNIDLATYGGIVSVKSGDTVLDTFKLNLKVHPEICEDGIVSDGDASSRSNADLEIVSIKEPDTGDDFKPGDEIAVEVKVKNNADDDMDVVVAAILYNLDEDEEIISVETADETVKDGKQETFEFDLIIPTSIDTETSDTYVVYLKAFEDGNEDQYCNFDSIEVEFKRNSNDVVVESIELLPSTVAPGESVDVTVDLQNAGKKDQDEVSVKVMNSELGISVVSNKFDLEKAGDSDDDITKRFTVTIPESAKKGDYLIEVAVYDEDGDVYDNGQSFSTLTVEVEEVEDTTQELDLRAVSNTKEIVDGKANLHFVLTNNEGEDVDAVVSLESNWATGVSQTVSLHKGENNVYFDIEVKEDVTEGMHAASLVVKPTSGDFDRKSYSFNFDVKDDGNALSFLEGKNSTLFWIIGDIVLVVVALFFIKAIFFGRKPE